MNETTETKAEIKFLTEAMNYFQSVRAARGTDPEVATLASKEETNFKHRLEEVRRSAAKTTKH